VRLPFLQVPRAAFAQARTLARLLKVPESHGYGLFVALHSWALEMAPEGDLSGRIDDAAPAVLLAAALDWTGNEEMLLDALIRTKMVERDASGMHRVAGLNAPFQADTYDVRVRLKTPEERALAEAEFARRHEVSRQRDMEARMHRDEVKRAASRVYFVQQEGADGLVKIGMTTRPVEVRLKEIQASHSCLLAVRASAPGGRRQESDLHWRFASLRVSGEWFRPGTGLMTYVALVASRGVL